MSTLNNFNQTVEDHENGYYFYLVDFVDIHSGQSYFRLIDCDTDATHAERMERFDADINGRMNGVGYDPRYEVVRYAVDMDEEEMAESGLRENVLHETYWDRTLQGAV